MQPNPDVDRSGNGLPYALAAYTAWGLFPLYLMAVSSIPPVELVGWRVLFTLPVCLLIVSVRRQWPDLFAALRNPKVLAWLCLSSLLIGCNWTLYVFAIVQGHVYATSLGYYINPLINVLIGTLFLGETLSRPQWTAVALAGVGVAILAAGALTTLWISVVLAISFALYGLVRRTLPVGSLPGLTVEAIVLTPFALIAIIMLAASPAGLHFGHNPSVDFGVAMAGFITAIPLLMFAIAARRMDYSTLGFVQFIAPTVVFILGLTVFHTPLKPVQLWSFIFIWAAIALFAWDLLRRRKTVKTATTA